MTERIEAGMTIRDTRIYSLSLSLSLACPELAEGLGIFIIDFFRKHFIL